MLHCACATRRVTGERELVDATIANDFLETAERKMSGVDADTESTDNTTVNTDFFTKMVPL